MTKSIDLRQFSQLMNERKFDKAHEYINSIYDDQNWNYFWLHALIFRELENFDQSISYCYKAIDKIPADTVDFEFTLSQIKFKMGICYQLKEDFSNSVRFLKESINHDEYLINNFNSLGLTYRKMDKFTDAEVIYNTGIKKLFDKINRGIDNEIIGEKNTWDTVPDFFSKEVKYSNVFDSTNMEMIMTHAGFSGCESIAIPTAETAAKFYEDKINDHPNDLGFVFYDTEENKKKTRTILPSYFDYMYRSLCITLQYSNLLNNLGVVKLELGLIEDARNLFKESIEFIPVGIDYRSPYNNLNHSIELENLL
jgi:tetratricopeptide (TPR) repeat protein